MFVGNSIQRSRRVIAVAVAGIALALGLACGGAGAPACGLGGDGANLVMSNVCAAPNGTLSVTADQSTCGTTTWSAEVFINGASQGRKQLGPFNPLSFSLPAGEYSVSVQLTDGVRTYTSPPVSTIIVSDQSTNRIVTCI